jgi:hypothetical protein
MREFGAAAALAAAFAVAGCTTTDSGAPMMTAAPADQGAPAPGAAPAGGQAAVAAPADAMGAPAGKPGTEGAKLAMAKGPVLAAPAGTCSMPLAAVPPVPNKAGAGAGAVGENIGRNVVRNVGTNVAGNVVARSIPGIGGIIGVAATQTAGKEIVHTAEDVRGTWTATDGAGCGCQLEFTRPGMVVTRKVVTQHGCRSALWQQTARWNQEERPGFAKVDLVLYAEDGRTELARLDGKSTDYYQGPVGGELVTIWR